MFKPTVQQVKQVFENKGYTFFDGKKPLNLNIVGIRSKSESVNEFNDTLMLIYRDTAGNEFGRYFPFTSKPSLHYLKHPMSPKGCAVLAEGQYLGVLKIAKHRGIYDALCQRGKMDYYRDNNGDGKIDYEGKKYSGIIGLNIHRAEKHTIAKNVGKHSAGCGVVQYGFWMVMAIAKKAREIWGNRFSYTLLNERDFHATDQD